MKSTSPCVALTVVMACVICLADLVSAQGLPAQRTRGFSLTKTLGFGRVDGSEFQNDDDGDETSPRSGAETQQRSNTSVKGSRSVSYMKNGKKVSITENASGINVSVDGKRFKAKNSAELKKRFPDAYRLYDEAIGATRISAGAFSGGSAHAGGGGGAGLPAQFNKDSLQNRSVSVIDNGKKISITQNETGIIVSVNGRQVRARNVAELKRKFPDAFRMYEKHLGKMNGRVDQPSDATVLLREELDKLRDENADNPQLRDLIDRMMNSVPR